MASRRSEPMAPVDTAWYRMEQRDNLMMITGVYMFDGPLDYDRLRATIEYRFLRYERFRQRVIPSSMPNQPPRWELDPHFDLDDHIHRFKLPPPGDKAMLQRYVSHLMSTPLDMSRPLWEFHLVEGYGGGSAIVSRLHHCIADGIALVSVMLSMLDHEEDAPWPEPLPEVDGRRRRRGPLASLLRPVTRTVRSTQRMAEVITHEGMETLIHPSKAVELTKLGVGTAGALGKLLLMPPDPKTVFKGSLQADKGAAWSEAIPLDEVKAIGKALRGTVNDVLLTAVAGALRRYLLDEGQPTDDLNIRAVIPVNLRPIDEVTPKLGNHFGLVFLSLPLGIEDPFDRLHELKRRMDDIKHSPEAVVALGILQVTGMVPEQIQDIIVNIFGMKATAVMTNVPGPREPLYLAGQPIKGVMFWVPQSGRLGLGVSILSFHGQVTLGIASDLGLIPNPGQIVTHFEEEFAEMMDLVRQVEEE
ncbi:MAG: wax ester/triacylglycerol synthase family O-acyltransferase [Anaerolineae bacterium]|nr:wax ester/triacylglycerol synthase family O-acyltransferase [Anaerolineae bacterium]